MLHPGNHTLAARAEFQRTRGAEEFDRSGRPYQEAIGRRDEKRPPYAEISRALGFDVLSPSQPVTKALENSPLNDRVRISPVPLVLTAEENRTLRSAADQYVRALTALFEDLALGDGRCIDHPQGIPKKALDAIFACTPFKNRETLKALWSGHSPEEILFSLGADIGRGTNGRFKLIELNIGNLGGMADCHFVPKTYLGTVGRGNALEGTGFLWQQSATGFFLPALLRNLRIDPRSDFVAATDHQAQSPKHGEEIDLEGQRWRGALKGNGIESYPKVADLPGGRVPRLLLNKIYEEQAEALWRGGRTAFLNPPGVYEVLSNKLLLPYVNALIRFYLREVPYVQAPAATILLTRKYADGTSYIMTLTNGAPEILSINRDLPSGAAIKSALGCCGKEVLIFPPGTRFDREAVMNLADKVEVKGGATPGETALVLQEFIPFSEINGCRVDVRPLAYAIGGGRAAVLDVPIGRAQKISGHSGGSSGDRYKNNVARGAYILPVFASR